MGSGGVRAEGGGLRCDNYMAELNLLLGRR